MARKSLVERVLERREISAPEKRVLDILGKGLFGLSRFSFLTRYHPWYRADKTDIRWLPINADIDMPENTPMPLNLLYRLIEEASHRVIVDECGCRVSFNCDDYPTEIGCLMMGESALECPATLSREVTVEEAKEHARKAVEAGLVPVVGKVRIDNFIFSIKDRARLLSVCFCCECCCISRYARYAKPKLLDPFFPRLDGIVVEVTDECIGCGECVEHCFIGAMEVVDGKAVIGEKCRACGRCSTVCSSGAVEIRIEDPDFLEKAYERIRSYVKYD